MLSIFATVDAPIGRFDPSMLDDSSRMELLISTLSRSSQRVITRPRNIMGGKALEDVCQWHGNMCDESRNIIKIDWDGTDVSGEISLDLLPEKLRLASMSTFEWTEDQPKLIGTLSTALLPRSLEVLDTQCNLFYGSVDLVTLPPKMERLLLLVNEFSGELNFTQLPPTLEDLDLAMNKFSGSIDLSSLPASLRLLHIEQNKLVGDPCLSNLPESLQSMKLYMNDFVGEFSYDNLPAGLQRIEIGRTRLVPVGTGEKPACITL